MMKILRIINARPSKKHKDPGGARSLCYIFGSEENVFLYLRRVFSPLLAIEM